MVHPFPMRSLLLVSAVLALALGAQAIAADWPQVLGPGRNGVYGGPPLSETWGATGPRVVWRRQIGQGLSGPVVVQNRVILFHRVSNREVVEAIDAASGKTLWEYAYPTSYRDDFGFDEGPRAVPVVANGIVYTFGAEGQLHAVDLAQRNEDLERGHHAPVRRAERLLWRRRFAARRGRKSRRNIGGKNAGIVAFDAKTGKVLWTVTDDGASYSSGIGATIAGRRYAVFLTRNGLVGLDPAAGQVRFERQWRARQAASVNAATPVVSGDLIFISAEYGPGAGVLRFDGSKLTDVWSSDEALSNHYATSVYLGGYLYGFHGRQEFGQSFRAVEFQTGKVRWSQDRFGAGSVTLAGNRLLILRENGEMVLAAASPDGFKPIARAQILPATVRAYPAIAGGMLYVRNDDTLVCLDLRK